MRTQLTLTALLTIASCIVAQDQQPKPYTEGDVEGFLQRARSSERPAMVLFNFDHESG